MGQSFSSLLKLRSFGLLFNVFQTDQINMHFYLVAFAVIAPFVSAGLLPDGSCHTTVYTALKGKLQDPEGNVIHFPNIERPRFCRKKCLQNPDCEYFLLMKEGDWIGCWLKSSDAEIVQGKRTNIIWDQNAVAQKYLKSAEERWFVDCLQKLTRKLKKCSRNTRRGMKSRMKPMSFSMSFLAAVQLRTQKEIFKIS